MRIDLLTLFPDMCETVLSESIIGRARRAGKLDIHCRNIRDYTLDKHRRVDDTPYGGGKGMLMQAEPIYRCYEAVCEDFGVRPHVIFMSPQGKPFTEKRAIELSQMEHILILCGHYEGVDQRVIDEIVDEEISIGDYVLTGGELERMEYCVGLEKLDREGLAALLDQTVERLREGLLTSPDRKRALALTEHVKALRSALDFNVGPGHIAGWLCAGSMPGNPNKTR